MDKKVIRAKVQLMLKYPFFGALSALLELVDYDGNTFATDGKHIFVPPKEYYDGTKGLLYDDSQLITVIAHETAHCAFLHSYREGNRNHMGWNVAGDLAINPILKQAGLSVNPAWLYNKDYEGMTAERIYELLPKVYVSSSGGGSGSGSGGGMSVPGNMNDIKDSKGQNKSKGKDTNDRYMTENDWKDAVAQAAQDAKQKGKLPGGLEQYIEEFLNPKIPWQQVLMRYLQTSRGCSDYRSYPYRRAHLHRGLYMSSLAGDSIELVCAIDTSGSIGDVEFKSFLGEICGICQAFGEYQIHLFQCDAQIHEYTVIESEADVPHKMKGRGGTSFVPVFEKVNELELDDLPLVYFTDLCGDFPSEGKSNTYWVVREEFAKQFKPPFGEVIELD
jgi:predicted metal-dependent peptidase